MRSSILALALLLVPTVGTTATPPSSSTTITRPLVTTTSLIPTTTTWSTTTTTLPCCTIDPARLATAGWPQVDAGGPCAATECPTLDDFCRTADLGADGCYHDRAGVGVTACTAAMPCDGSVLGVAGTPMMCGCAGGPIAQPATCLNPALLACAAGGGQPDCPMGTSKCEAGGFRTCCNDTTQTCKQLSSFGVKRPACQAKTCDDGQWCKGTQLDSCCPKTAKCQVQFQVGVCGDPKPCTAPAVECGNFCCDPAAQTCLDKGFGVKYCVPKDAKSCPDGTVHCDGKDKDDRCCKKDGEACYVDANDYPTCVATPPNAAPDSAEGGMP